VKTFCVKLIGDVSWYTLHLREEGMGSVGKMISWNGACLCFSEGLSKRFSISLFLCFVVGFF